MEFLIVEQSKDEALFARFRGKGKGLVFQGLLRKKAESAEAFSAVIAEVAKESAEGERIILSLPPSALFFREVVLPIADRRKLREVLPLELKGVIAADTSELVFDAVPMHGGGFLAVWAKQGEIKSLIDRMAVAGGEPQMVTASLIHWERLIPQGMSGYVALSDGEALAVYLDRLPVFIRPLGDGDFHTEVTRTLAALEIAKEVSVQRVFLHGAAASQIGEREGISFISLPVEGELVTAFGGDQSLACEAAGAFAVAAACRDGEIVNFRHGALAWTAGIAKARKKLRLTAALILILITGLCADLGVRFYLLKQDIASIDSAIGSVYREIFPNRRKPVDEVGEVKAEIRRLSGGAEGGSSLLKALRGIAAAKGEEVTAIYEVEMEGNQLRMKGEARSFNAVNSFKSGLASMFDNPEVADLKTRPDGTVTFLFRGTLKGEEK
ncbi:MAG: general secretion pathway protein GspL [Geobacter sp.]|nr:general secretion pathway protein GspL [Geobacter sp.]